MFLALPAALLLPTALLVAHRPSSTSTLRVPPPTLSTDAPPTPTPTPTSATDDPAVLALTGTRLRLSLNIGREAGTWMPTEWAASGARLVLPVDVSFTPDPAPTNRAPERLLGERPFYYAGTRRLAVEGEASFVGAEGVVRVPVSDGAWRAVSVTGEGGGEYFLRGYLDFDSEVSRNDVTLPAGRVFFTTGFWEAGSYEKASVESTRLRAQLDAKRDDAKTAAGEGITQLRRAVLLQEELETLYQRTAEAAVPEREEMVEAAGGRLLLSGAGGLCVKRRGPPWRLWGEEYHILGRLSMSALQGGEAEGSVAKSRLGNGPRMMCMPEQAAHDDDDVPPPAKAPMSPPPAPYIPYIPYTPPPPTPYPTPTHPLPTPYPPPTHPHPPLGADALTRRS